MDPVIVDQSAWPQLRVTGADRKRFLQGMVSNDVGALAVGGFCRATMLNAKGRVLAVLDVIEEGDGFLLVSEPGTGDKVRELLDKHIIADDVELAVVQRPLFRVWDSLEAVWSAPPVFGEPGAASPARASEVAVEARRIEAGLPRYGVDVGEDYFPFEANLERAISFKKGCYIGQEVVVRGTTRGQAKKRLVGLVVAGEGALAPGSKVAANVAGEHKEDAGTVTSSVVSPRLGAIALAYLHHSLCEPGTEVSVGGRTAVVSALPFAAA